MMDLVEQFAAALKKIKAEVTGDEFTLDELCQLIRSNTGCTVDAQARFLLSEMLSKRRDVRPLDTEGGKWRFGSYTPPVTIEKTIETAA